MNTQRDDEAPDAVTMKTGDLELDPVFLKLRYGEKTVDLAPCESRIIACLMQHAGRPMPASELRLHALGSRPIHPTTALEKHICSIRKKIAAIRAATTSKTIRGQGYLMN